MLLLETSQDMLNVKAAFIGIKQAFKKTGKELPIMISGTIEPMGTTLAGQSIEAFYISIEHMNPISVGLNCATGPEFMQDHIRTLSDLSIVLLAVTQMQVFLMKKGIIMNHRTSLAQKMKDLPKKVG